MRKREDKGHEKRIQGRRANGCIYGHFTDNQCHARFIFSMFGIMGIKSWDG